MRLVAGSRLSRSKGHGAVGRQPHGHKGHKLMPRGMRAHPQGSR